MRNIKEAIQGAIKTALKEKREIESSTLRMFLAMVLNKEKEKRYRLSVEKPDFNPEQLEKESMLTDEELIESVFSEVKKRKDAIVEFEKGKRDDLVKKERSEIAVLKKYLPEQISEEEIRKLAKEAIAAVGASTIKEMGKVMAALMPNVKGKAEGGTVSRIVRELLVI